MGLSPQYIVSGRTIDNAVCSRNRGWRNVVPFHAKHKHDAILLQAHALLMIKIAHTGTKSHKQTVNISNRRKKQGWAELKKKKNKNKNIALNASIIKIRWTQQQHVDV